MINAIKNKIGAAIHPITGTQIIHPPDATMINTIGITCTLLLSHCEIFTTTLDRKRKFEQWLQDYKIRGDVLKYEEIRYLL